MRAVAARSMLVMRTAARSRGLDENKNQRRRRREERWKVKRGESALSPRVPGGAVAAGSVTTSGVVVPGS